MARENAENVEGGLSLARAGAHPGNAIASKPACVMVNEGVRQFDPCVERCHPVEKGRPEAETCPASLRQAAPRKPRGSTQDRINNAPELGRKSMSQKTRSAATTRR